ncbi:hypothetical protein BX661DRAFT_53788 [Kickxella alabastrina]|uniref:uncharacterized protein n=1 Tax=Kickxella alabastrina TaxID=61397 RepID=UPI00221FC4C2|nr:uncharacterized protein BX661DRAFT_53788 [Kickxella alabastrina]KAI7824006.1 hypothetical protein BX661DRAFT_53788 [Kickxella alabastrina]
MILAGEMGAPYAMRLLHASHLCVWGKYAFGHYEVYEPGLASLPPLSSLMLAPPLPDEAEPEEPEGEKFASNDPRATLVQLEATHREMELMYRDMASDRDSIFPEGRRIERQRRNRVPADERYHLINIDMPFEESPNGQVLCADFRRALFVFGTFIDIYDVEKRQEGKPKGAPFGIFPVDPLPGTELPPGPPSLSLPVAGADEEQRMEEQEMEDSEWVTDPSDDGVSDNDDHSVDEVDEVGEINETGEADDGRFNVRHILQHLGFGIHNGDPLQSPPPIVPPSSLNASSSILTIETAVLQSVFCLRISSDAPHDPPNESSPFSAKNLAESREFLGKYMPELLAACLARAPVDSLISAAPYYIQRLYESRFSNEPVATVDHRGERTTGQKVASDMERIMRAVGVQPLWSVPGIVSPAAVMMDFVSSAMDDSKVAVGCNNGYVVITCFD